MEDGGAEVDVDGGVWRVAALGTFGIGGMRCALGGAADGVLGADVAVPLGGGGGGATAVGAFPA